MLGKAKCGWVNIFVADKCIGSGSYICDVSMDILNAFIEYFKKENKLPFSLLLDSETYRFGLIEWNDDLFFISTACFSYAPFLDRIDPALIGGENCILVKDALLCLAKEAVNDIERDFEDYVYWFDDPDFMTEEDKLRREKELKEGIEKLKNIIKDIGK